MRCHVYLNFPGSPAEKYDLPLGKLQADDALASFELKGHVGGGGNSAVFLADHYRAAKYVGRCAVKVLKQLDPVRVDRFNNELRILKGLDHESIASYHAEGHVVHVQRSGVKIPWVAMTLGGNNLRRQLEERGVLVGDALVGAALDMCDALEHLHSRSIIHRDVKPDNFVFDSFDSDRVKMIDFGIAKYIGEDVAARPFDNLTKMKEFVGPQAFSSPELLAYAADKDHPVDQRSDLFQLGKVFWFVATGIISAGVPSKRADPFGGPLHKLVSCLLSDDPMDRLPDAKAVREALEAL